MGKKLGKIGKNTGITLAGPVVVYLFFLALTNLTGNPRLWRLARI